MISRTRSSGSTNEGFGRLDALNRIGNQVFSLDLNNPNNYASHSAPVHYPRIWNAPWFSWVQYNASIEQPMVRNAGEALGVTAELNLTDDKKTLFSSSAQVKTLYEMEQMIAGDQPTAASGFTGLSSPKWPKDILPAIDEKLAAQGATLYATHCQGCHLPPVGTKAFFEFPAMAGAEPGRTAPARSRTDRYQAYRHRFRAGRGPLEPQGDAAVEISALRAMNSARRSARWSRRRSTSGTMPRSRPWRRRTGSG